MTLARRPDTVQSMDTTVDPMVCPRLFNAFGSGDGDPIEDYGTDEKHPADDTSHIPMAVDNIRIPDRFPMEGPTRILVICASPGLRDETIRILQTDGGPGWAPDAVGDIAMARTKLMLEVWDLVLLRLDGGRLDHPEVFRSVRGAGKWPPPPVVAVLDPDSTLKAELEGLGASRILPAPATSAEVIEAIRSGLATADPSAGRGWETERGPETGFEGDEPRV